MKSIEVTPEKGTVPFVVFISRLERPILIVVYRKC